MLKMNTPAEAESPEDPFLEEKYPLYEVKLIARELKHGFAKKHVFTVKELKLIDHHFSKNSLWAPMTPDSVKDYLRLRARGALVDCYWPLKLNNVPDVLKFWPQIVKAVREYRLNRKYDDAVDMLDSQRGLKGEFKHTWASFKESGYWSRDIEETPGLKAFYLLLGSMWDKNVPLFAFASRHLKEIQGLVRECPTYLQMIIEVKPGLERLVVPDDLERLRLIRRLKENVSLAWRTVEYSNHLGLKFELEESKLRKFYEKESL